MESGLGPAQRHRRSWLGWLGLCCLGMTVLGVNVAASSETGQTGGDTSAVRGGELYQRWCATCHATDGSGTTDGPSLQEVDVAYLDLTMRTGRMPLTDPAHAVRGRRFDDGERALTVAYLTDLLDLEGEIPAVPAGSAAAGRSIYGLHCAACHGAGGGGGLAGDGTDIPKVVGLDSVAIAEATRVGPFQMPRFGEEVISDDGIADLAAFLDEEAHPPASPLGYAAVNRGLAAAFAGALALMVIGLCVWASRGSDRPQTDGGGPG